MKKFLLSAMVIVPAALLAQPTITESQFTLAVGDVITSYSQTYATPSIGANQTWDYTAFTLSSPSTTNIVNPSAAAITGLQASTYCFSTSGAFDCYLKNSSGVQRTGIKQGTVEIAYQNGEVVINFPITFNHSATDPFHSAYTIQTYNGSRRGTVLNEVVGYGTLNLPNSVTINDAMLIRSHELYTDSLYITPISQWQVISYDYTNYNFYAAGYKGAIVTMSSGTAGPQATSFGSYSVAGATSSLETFDISNQVTVFPNPAEDMITVTNNGNFELEGFDYKIVNLNGQVIKTGIFTSNTLTVSELETGLYVLQITNDNFSATKKFLKK